MHFGNVFRVRNPKIALALGFVVSQQKTLRKSSLKHIASNHNKSGPIVGQTPILRQEPASNTIGAIRTQSMLSSSSSSSSSSYIQHKKTIRKLATMVKRVWYLTCNPEVVRLEPSHALQRVFCLAKAHRQRPHIRKMLHGSGSRACA